MDICGEVVEHKAFGRGEIIKFENNHITVLFDKKKDEKIFVYPSVFENYLKTDNEVFLKEIEKDKNKIAEYELIKKQEEIKRIDEEYERMVLERKNTNNGKISSKTNDKNNIAFKCNYCDGGNSKETVGYKGICSDETIKYNISVAKHVWCSDPESKCNQYLKGNITREELSAICENDGFICYESQMLRLWRAYAGISRHGEKKGKPMKLKNVKINSLAFLTTRLPSAKDKDRFIFAVFLIDENYEGDNKEEGYVASNSKYRIQLSLDEAEKLKFWDYYFNQNNPQRIVFGSGLHRYLTDVQAAQILKKICEIKKETPEEELSKEFLDHYCSLNNIDVNDIPAANGALLR
ncbi:MAG: hypothetical protein ACERKV_11095 [Clostridiaceae bacterium]